MTVVFGLVALVTVAAALLVMLRLQQGQRSLADHVVQLDQRVAQRVDALEERLGAQVGQLHATFGSAQHTLLQLGTELGQLRTAAERMQAVGAEVGQLSGLLRAPVLRGALGEVLLERLLSEVLPEQLYARQFRFRDGTAVDAAVRLGERWLPVDAKFPMEAFARLRDATEDSERNAARREAHQACLRHVDAVAKYVRPDESTTDVAFLYVPAESIFFALVTPGELAGKETLQEYALSKRVVITSPNSLYAYLLMVERAEAGFRLQKEAGRVRDLLARMTREFDEFLRGYDQLGTHLQNAGKKYDELQRRGQRVGDALRRPLEAADELAALPAAEEADSG